MIGTSLITEFLHTILLTGRVHRESPVSTFLIAKPESGKTSICLESEFSCAVDVTDSTGKGLLEIMKYKAEISHIIFNDLTIITGHSRNVQNYLISIINAMTEEGIRSVAFPGQVEIFKNGKRGIIACTTPQIFKDKRAWFNKIGLTSRCVPFHYTYSEPLVVKIKAQISNEVEERKPKVLSIPAATIDVTISDNIRKEILLISDEKAKEFEEIGLRRLKQFMRLAKAHSLLRTWKNPHVTDEDIDFIKRIFPYIDYKKGCLL